MSDIEVATLTDDQLAEALQAATHRMLVTRIASSAFTGIWAVVYALSNGRLDRYPAFLPIALAVFLTGAAIVWTRMRAVIRELGAVRAELKRRGRQDLLPPEPQPRAKRGVREDRRAS